MSTKVYGSGTALVKATFVNSGMLNVFSKQKIADLNKLTEATAGSLAEVAKRKMSNVLKKEHRFNVGASNRASENLYVMPVSTGEGNSAWGVVIGSDTNANDAIRWGIREGKAPSVSTLVKWAAQKGWTPVSYYTARKDVIARKAHVRTTKSGAKVPVKASKKSSASQIEREKLDPFYRIQYILFHYGTLRSKMNSRQNGPHWFDYARGKQQGKFDYPTYIMKQDSSFQEAAGRIKAKAQAVFVEYLSTADRSGIDKLNKRSFITDY